MRMVLACTIGVFMLATVDAVAGYYYSIPPQYDHYNSHMKIRYKSLEQLIKICSPLEHDPNVRGCMFWISSANYDCLIILPLGTKKSSEIYRHEQAHCNGWHHPKTSF